MDQQRLQQLIGSDYTLQWVIGHGGMSTVWLADDNVHDREVAIKVLRPEFSDNAEFLGRFRNEATSAQQITSDNVVATYDYRELEDLNGAKFCFMALEYVRGESLADRLARDGALPEAQALEILEQAAYGLSVIHGMGMVHRDIKPGNMLITQNGQVKITDFGIAKAAAAVPLTRTGMVVGTAQYVSPEQAQGQKVTAASDIYSLGVVGYEMLAGQRPFSGDSSVSVALAHISQVAAPLSTAISAPTRELIGIALRKDPTTRYADGTEFAHATSAVRFGKRPPQPAATTATHVAPLPSATAATTVHPATLSADTPTTSSPIPAGPAGATAAAGSTVPAGVAGATAPGPGAAAAPTTPGGVAGPSGLTGPHTPGAAAADPEPRSGRAGKVALAIVGIGTLVALGWWGVKALGVGDTPRHSPASSQVIVTETVTPPEEDAPEEPQPPAGDQPTQRPERQEWEEHNPVTVEPEQREEHHRERPEVPTPPRPTTTARPTQPSPTAQQPAPETGTGDSPGANTPTTPDSPLDSLGDIATALGSIPTATP
ncbi:protein kinase [Corynebacterium lizhenjunii]|uniref:non-specific serine/threonine protein kinase n=1 Tax=Corynebacterium lizhenjunii TaxID=2709394 RepID=A0A7T0PAL8_9CORY|nr:serine/threonine-protein kinase [Corynebacterium lizhenjunii]QPK79201.1 protein kinase [Corynebacterium lizhenjunii]